METSNNIRQQWNDALFKAGIPAMTTDKAVRLLAVLYVAGNNEEMVLNPGFIADLEYIQKRWRISGGEVPDLSIREPLLDYIKELEDYEEEARKEKRNLRPQWVHDLLKSYGIKTIN